MKTQLILSILLCSVQFCVLFANTKLSGIALFVDDQVGGDNDTNFEIYSRENLSSSLSNEGFHIITHQTITRTIAEYKESENSKSTYSSLTDNNIQTLSQQLGADYFLILTLGGLSTEMKDLPNFDRKIYTHRLKANFRLAKSSNSESIMGKNLQATKRIPVTSKILIQSSKQMTVKGLIDDIVDEIVDHMLKSPLSLDSPTNISKDANVRVPEAEPNETGDLNKVKVFISAKLQKMFWPEISRDENQKLILTGKKYQMQTSDAEIEIDGLFVGNCSTTQPVLVTRGLRRLKVIRSGFIVQEKMINAYEGLKLSILLVPTSQEYNRWQSQINFLQKIKVGERLTEIEARKADGLYEFLKNSKYETPDSITYKSLF